MFAVFWVACWIQPPHEISVSDNLSCRANGVKWQTMRLSLRPKAAVLVFTTLTILLIVVAVTVLLLDFRKRELEHERLETESVSRMLMGQVKETFDGVDLMLQGVQERLQTLGSNRLALDSLPVYLLLKARRMGLPHVSSLYVVDANGEAVNSSHEFPQARGWIDSGEGLSRLAAARNDELFISSAVRKRSDTHWTLALGRKITDSEGHFLGAVMATLELAYFEQHFELMNFDEPRVISLYLADGTLVASRPHREDAIGRHASELGDDIPQASGDEFRIFLHQSKDSAQPVLTLGRVAKYPLLVSVASDQNEALSYWRATAAPIALGVGLVCLFIILAASVLIYELSREEALAKALRESNERYQRTMDSVTDAIVTINDQRHITMLNRAAEQLFGLHAQDAIGTPVGRLVPERLRDVLEKNVDEAIRTNSGAQLASLQAELAGQRSDGHEFPIESTFSQTVIDGQAQLTIVLRDVTQRHHAESEQREMNRQLRDLSASLQNVREQERTRISRELHDDLGQQLTGLKLDLSWLSNRLKEGRTASQERLDSMRYLLDDAIAAVRRISGELRPLILDDLGFGEAVSWHAGELSRRSEIEIVLDLAAAERVTENAMATALFRIVQESLTNIVRHADATRVEIALVTDGASIVLTIRDNGKGLPAGVLKIGIGLVSMRERATALGGNLVFCNHSAGGTLIEVSVPIHSTAPSTGAS